MTEDTTITMTLGFDPMADEETAKVFSDHLAMRFYLLWRRTHVVVEDFPAAVNWIIRRLRTADPPYTDSAVLVAIRPEITGAGSFSLPDAEKFSVDVLPYLNGEKVIYWKRN